MSDSELKLREKILKLKSKQYNNVHGTSPITINQDVNCELKGVRFAYDLVVKDNKERKKSVEKVVDDLFALHWLDIEIGIKMFREVLNESHIVHHPTEEELDKVVDKLYESGALNTFHPSNSKMRAREVLRNSNIVSYPTEELGGGE